MLHDLDCLMSLGNPFQSTNILTVKEFNSNDDDYDYDETNVYLPTSSTGFSYLLARLSQNAVATRRGSGDSGRAVEVFQPRGE
ncbi:jg2448 [Pararge aegeria aegeria]|uniref:Jg2448 protein n=1 Tax=Pararge aegeria aegeria TaxID=348720 RepID=A0A8S4S3J4_9NEOP|nr:jg2448 [Pararge aegeria aegeria]